MLIRHIGHSEFFIETESGFRLLTDPYGAGCGYPVRKIAADAVMISHNHFDHNGVENLTGNYTILDRAGEYTPAQDVRITAVRGYHDTEQGTRRGETLLFLAETEGIKIVHLGDLGCELNREQSRLLINPDILMIPVGGYYTINGAQAAKTAKEIGARVILPMHYRTIYNRDWPISGPEDFMKEFGEKNILENAEALRVTKGDLDCQPRVVLFRQ